MRAIRYRVPGRMNNAFDLTWGALSSGVAPAGAGTEAPLHLLFAGVRSRWLSAETLVRRGRRHES